MKNLRLKNINYSNSLTLGELNSEMGATKFDFETPIVCKFGNKNYKVCNWYLKNGKFILGLSR